MEIKLALVGSRSFNDFELLKKTITEFTFQNNFTITSIISGGCRGADQLAKKYSEENHIDLITFQADWGRYGKQAGFIRNHDIIKACDVCLAFYDGLSKGTAHDINLCSQYNKPCFVYNFIEGFLYQIHDAKS